MRRFFLVSLLMALSACRREPVPPAAAPSSGPATNQAATAAAVTVTAARYPGAERVVAIGDLHGSLAATRAALRLAGAIDGSDQWIGGKLVVVQTGDEVDRGDGEREILDLFDRLAEESKASGGAVHALLGNHETMTVAGDFRSATEGGFKSFEGVSPKAPGAARFGEHERARAEAFLPGGAYALKLAKRDTIAIVGDTVFSHAGIVPQHVAYGIDRANAGIREWIAGHAEQPGIVMEKPSPLWNRLYGQPQLPEETCRDLRVALSSVGAKRMVVGHTIQDEGISSACDGQVWRIDIGMFSNYPKKPVQVLQISGGAVTVLRGEHEG
ncbi:MAG: metallophosphoesterase [Myxococcales bacterium]